MNSENTEAPAVKTQEDSFSKSFSTFNRQIVGSMEAVSKLADKGPSNLLLSLGTVLFIVALFMKLEVFGVGVANLKSSEFIALILVAAILLLAGSYLRLYQYKGQQDINRELRQAGLEILQRTERTAEDLAKTGAESTPNL